jgi:beta-N-acetylhexosaminidase
MKQSDRLTLEEKVGQLFCLGFQGYEPENETRDVFDVVRPGGFLLFQRNIEGFDQVYELNSRLREMFSVQPFLVIDHEGGRVDRLKQIFGPIPSMSQLAESGTAQLRIGARIIAAELEATGFNVDLAPVLDLRRTGSIVSERSLSGDPAQVARLAGAFIEELSNRGILACGKHFPGLGGAIADPHFALPRIDANKRVIMQEDITPFVKLFDALGMIMIAHAHYPGLGDEKPVPGSLSTRVIEGFLRKKLGYKGVVITDDLAMGAITSFGLTPELFLRAFEAGNDVLLFSQSTPLVEDAFKTILKAVRGSASLRERLELSVERILTLKSRVEVGPLRYRTHLKARISRQAEKLRNAVVEIGARHVTV